MERFEIEHGELCDFDTSRILKLLGINSMYGIYAFVRNPLFHFRLDNKPHDGIFEIEWDYQAWFCRKVNDHVVIDNDENYYPRYTLSDIQNTLRKLNVFVNVNSKMEEKGICYYPTYLGENIEPNTYYKDYDRALGISVHHGLKILLKEHYSKDDTKNN